MTSRTTISNSTLALSQFSSGAPVGYTYRYDQLNRLKKTRQHTGISGTSWTRSSITPNYQENATYDANGNILTYGRNGAAPTAQTIDSLTYNYARDANNRLTSNKLQSINDAITTSNYSLDLTNQTNTTNYRYDAIGNLIYDAQSLITGNDGVNSITWSVYGKIISIYKTTGTISYTYNPAGQRVSKTAGGIITYYVRDAQGNALAVYDNKGSAVNWREQHLYGSSRLGIWTPNVNLATNNAAAVWDTTGRKQYELNNHLGNVLATITDKRLQHTTSGTAIDYFTADVATEQDYYPFGMLQPGRQYTYTGNGTYRYGFNGKENDNEVKGVGNQQNYGERISDPRIGRFLSTDPITSKYPSLTPYQFASNSPIANTDLDGKEAKYYVIDLNSQQPKLRYYKTEDVIPFFPKFLQPDVVSVEVLGLNTTYTFQAYAQQGNFIKDFDRFKEDPVAAIYSGKYVTDRQILSTVVRDLVLTALIARSLRVPDISLEEGMQGAKFAQNGNFSKNFSEEGQNKYSKLAGFKIKSVDDLANAIKGGKVKASDIFVDYVMIRGEKVILNTRTSAALNKANIPMSQWTGSNKTGVKVPGLGDITFDQLGQDQINNNYKPHESLSSTPPK